MNHSLDRNSWQPLYSQISEQIRQRIENELAPGDQLPSENELMDGFGVSRNTARLAVDLLIKQGLAQRVKGRGTYVTPQRWQFGLYRLVSFSEETRNRGMQPSSRLIDLRQIVPSSKILKALNLQPGSEVYAVERLRLADDKPMAINNSFLPLDICPGLDQEDLSSGSIYKLIEEKYRLQIGYAQQVLKPVIASRVEADLLQMKTGGPLLLVEGTTYLVDGRPLEYNRLLYRGDRYEFPIQAVRQPNITPQNGNR
jgi:GntR family transcriptional regulator